MNNQITIKDIINYESTKEYEENIKVFAKAMYDQMDAMWIKLNNYQEPEDGIYKLTGLFSNQKDQPIDYQI